MKIIVSIINKYTNTNIKYPGAYWPTLVVLVPLRVLPCSCEADKACHLTSLSLYASPCVSRIEDRTSVSIYCKFGEKSHTLKWLGAYLKTHWAF